MKGLLFRKFWLGSSLRYWFSRRFTKAGILVVCGLFLTIWDIYGTTFKDVLPPVHDVDTGKTTKPGPNVPAGKRGKRETP